MRFCAKGEYEQASRTIDLKGCVVWPKWMKVWMGSEGECETAQRAPVRRPTTVGLAGPPENRVQMFYLTEELKYTLDTASGRCSCFFSRQANRQTEKKKK